MVPKSWRRSRRCSHQPRAKVDVIAADQVRASAGHASCVPPLMPTPTSYLRPCYFMTPSIIAVVGAGMAGLTCARTLSDHGLDVTVFDKGRAPGGRTSSRRAGAFHFDHGAQYFTARDSGFPGYVESWRDDGLVDVWSGHMVTIARDRIDDVDTSDDRFVGVPGMNALAKHLAQDLDVTCGVQIEALNIAADGWHLGGAHGVGFGPFDMVVVAVPAAQALPLLDASPRLAERVAKVGISPCWAVLLGFEEPLDLPFDAAWASENPLFWMARNNSKPGRPLSESWVLHAGRDWSEAHLEDDAEAVVQRLQDAFQELTGSGRTSTYRTAHRWRYALAHQPLGETCLFDRDIGIGVCGDWCLAGRVEAAFLSGTAMAGRILSQPECAHANAPDQVIQSTAAWRISGAE